MSEGGSVGDMVRRLTTKDLTRLPVHPHWKRDRSHSPVLNYHLNMLLDGARMDSYRRAIEASVKPGDVVVDMGCGTGILSFMACEAGASKVYAIESGPIIETARELAIDNGFADRIEFLDGWSTKVDVPERANVLITETIGSAGLDEGIIGFVCDARERLVRTDAVILPQRLRLWVAAVETFEDHALAADWWSPDLPYDYSAARRRAERNLWFADITPEFLLGQPELAADVDFFTVEDETTSSSGELQIDRDGSLHGLACWFDSLLCPGVTVDNLPPREDSSWSHGFLPLAEPLEVQAGHRFAWELTVSADGEHWTWTMDYIDEVDPTPDSAQHVVS